MCSVFFGVKTDGVTDVLTAVLDGSRWPSSVFRGATRVLLTFIVPLGLMTSVPASALLGHVDTRTVGVALGEALVFSLLARRVWGWSVARYTSASN